MSRLIIAGYLIFLVGYELSAQTFTDSNLPILIINTDSNAGIPDQSRVLGNMKIVYSGDGVRNYLSDLNNTAVLNYNGRIEIETRGSSSQSLSKKQYALTTLLPDNVSNNNVSLLGMPKENDWVLNGLAFDPSLIRDYLSYTLSRKIGAYAPRTVYCEVIINSEYRGLYLLQEKIKVDDNRVDIIKIESNDITQPDLSGGYLTKADKVTPDDPSAWTMASYTGTVNFIHEWPKPTQITIGQNNYIKSTFELLSATANNTSLVNGFPSVIDVPSFVDFIIINELSANIDAYQFSTFFHKDRNGKLRAGPLWDVNLSYGNDLFLWNLDRSKTNLWQFDNGDNTGAKFWKDLFNNLQFKCYLSKRWNSLTQAGQPLNLTTIGTLIDETVSKINEAAVREQTKWGWEKSAWKTSTDLTTQINGIKTFLAARISWMNSNIGPFSACSNVVTPPLVITRINYHPNTSANFPESNDQEFIEITNNGSVSVPLTGIYFRGTGFVYQFPAGSALPSQGVIQLANKLATFGQLHGFLPFGEFTRNLSNASQNLTLADGFGNVIDEVEYSSQAPWPNADGNGYYLKLSSPNLDNSQADNWVASNEAISSTVVIVGTEDRSTSEIELYPNPTDNFIQVNSISTIQNIQISDLRGKLIEGIPVGSTSISLDLSQLAKGMYLLMISTENEIVVRKIFKK